ncbi:MAG: hypothetical protein AVDCRST_MAG22-1041, partial [uncultured Rubrobacteraceae bacterium]
DAALVYDPRRRPGERGDQGLRAGARRRERAPAAGEHRDLAASTRPSRGARGHRDLRRGRSAGPGREGPRRRGGGGRPPAAGPGAHRRLPRGPHRRAGPGLPL